MFFSGDLNSEPCAGQGCPRDQDFHYWEFLSLLLLLIDKVGDM